jgi:hypothetical protein
MVIDLSCRGAACLRRQARLQPAGMLRPYLAGT